MRKTFTSTRSQPGPSGGLKFFGDVVVEGLAPDGGLYVPSKGFPKLEPSEWLRLAKMSYPERALVILEKCIHPMHISPLELRSMVNRAYGENFASESVAPVKQLTEEQYVLELFHGPTASFKDLALQLMPQIFAHCLPQMCRITWSWWPRLEIQAVLFSVGSASLKGVTGLKLQMTAYKEGNVRSVSVLSDFDFCQRSIKRMFGHSSLTGHLAVEYATVLSTANSINWGRLLPQVVYHCSAYLDLLRRGAVTFGNPIDVCIPTGNFGNAMSAIYAKQMGIPIRNCVISDFISTGQDDLRGRKLVVSISPAIDILKSSNLERFMYHTSGGDIDLVRGLFMSLEKGGRLVPITTTVNSSDSVSFS
uniref:Threonine synthase like 1 n=1 Tax=Pygocentrus nattereri TaxID=42514 RepID=A0AAR2K261_PYGNA